MKEESDYCKILNDEMNYYKHFKVFSTIFIDMDQLYMYMTQRFSMIGFDLMKSLISIVFA